VIFQNHPLSEAAYLRVLVPTTGLEIAADATPNSPVWRHTSVDFRFRPDALAETLKQARDALHEAVPAPPLSSEDVDDPGARLALAFDEVLAVGAPQVRSVASAIALVGDLELEDVLPMLEKTFGDLSPAGIEPAAPEPGPREVVIDLAVNRPQVGLGYVVAAPSAGDPDWLAWRMLLWVLSHGYEGRLGVEAISRRGLVYYIDAEYLNDGTGGRVSLAIGVDPDKLGDMRALLGEKLQGLADEPPTDVEVAEAKSYLVGRRLSAAQSNQEVSAELMEEWVGRGRLLSDEEFAAAVNAVSRQDLERVIPAFLAGTTIVVKGVE
jgi:predicted Zn-dependent peptidase